MGKKIALEKYNRFTQKYTGCFWGCKAYLRQVINGWFLHLAGVLIEQFLEGSALLSLKALVS